MTTALPPGPSYAAGTLADLLPSVAAGLGVPGAVDRLGLGDADRVVVLLVDGLGVRQLAAAADVAPGLAALLPGVGLQTGFPSTTPAGLGSLGTGLPPGAHGLVGAAFRLPETGRTLWPLGWKDDPNPVATQPEPTVLERAARAGVAVTSVAPRAFAGSGLTRAALRGADYRGADSLGERVAETAAAIRRGGRALVYAYLGDLDRTGHVHGVDSDHWRAELAHVDLVVAQLRAVLPAGAVLYVTADHGMVDCPDDARVDLDADPRLRDGVALVAGEPRARHVYARPGAAGEVAAAWREVLGERAWVVERAEALAAGWFGEVEPEYEERIGDVLAVARDATALASPSTDSIVSSLRGQHGALTPDELEVPLLVVRG